MWTTVLLLVLAGLSETKAEGYCVDVLDKCQSNTQVSFPRCYEDGMLDCTEKPSSSRMSSPGIVRRKVDVASEAEERPSTDHHIRIKPPALQMGRGNGSEEKVLLIAAVLNSTLFKLSPQKGRNLHPHLPGSVMGGHVLMLRAGKHKVANLRKSVSLTFKLSETVKSPKTCVFWEESLQNDGTGYWSTYGCETNVTQTEVICDCDHMSFFAVLVNPVLTVDEKHAVILGNITYVGSSLSVVFTVISLVIYVFLQRRRPEKAIGVHIQLTVALLCLHLSFLVSSFAAKRTQTQWLCQGLGLFLHWSLLATFSWTALEGFHLYLLLVKVFNIYVRRYLLKLSLVGWGIPTLTVVVCGISGVYGKYTLELNDNNQTSPTEICWLSTDFSHIYLVSYITNVAFPCVVILCNLCMLALVVYKICGLRAEKTIGMRSKHQENDSRLLKDVATVLGLSCVLGISWAFMSTTYMSLLGIYVFTILNSLQGVFIFLWCVALSCKPRSDFNSSTRDPSTQKMMTTSFNN